MGISVTGKDITIVSKTSFREWYKRGKRHKRSRIFQQRFNFYRTTTDARPKQTRFITMKGRWHAGESLDTLKVRIFGKLENKRYFSSAKYEVNASFSEATATSKKARRVFQNDAEIIACMHIKSYKIFVKDDRTVTAIIEGYGCSSKDMRKYTYFRNPFVQFLGRDGSAGRIFLKSVRGAIEVLKGSFWARD